MKEIDRPPRPPKHLSHPDLGSAWRGYERWRILTWEGCHESRGGCCRLCHHRQGMGLRFRTEARVLQSFSRALGELTTRKDHSPPSTSDQHRLSHQALANS